MINFRLAIILFIVILNNNIFSMKKTKEFKGPQVEQYIKNLLVSDINQKDLPIESMKSKGQNMEVQNMEVQDMEAQDIDIKDQKKDQDEVDVAQIIKEFLEKGKSDYYINMIKIAKNKYNVDLANIVETIMLSYKKESINNINEIKLKITRLEIQLRILSNSEILKGFFAFIRGVIEKIYSEEKNIQKKYFEILLEPELDNIVSKITEERIYKSEFFQKYFIEYYTKRKFQNCFFLPKGAKNFKAVRDSNYGYFDDKNKTFTELISMAIEMLRINDLNIKNDHHIKSMAILKFRTEFYIQSFNIKLCLEQKIYEELELLIENIKKQNSSFLVQIFCTLQQKFKKGIKCFKCFVKKHHRLFAFLRYIAVTISVFLLMTYCAPAAIIAALSVIPTFIKDVVPSSKNNIYKAYESAQNEKSYVGYCLASGIESLFEHINDVFLNSLIHGIEADGITNEKDNQNALMNNVIKYLEAQDMTKFSLKDLQSIKDIDFKEIVDINFDFCCNM
jgi:hypothetical protein